MEKKKNITITYILVYKFYSLLGHLCRIAFSLFSRGKLSADKPLSDLSLIFFSGRKGAKMIKAVLFSIYYRWEKIPYVIIVSDGTPNAVLLAAMQSWPFPFEIKSWEDCAAFHLEKGRSSIVDFARINTYARKLIAVLAEAETKPVLYCDTDVLWFSEPRLPVSPRLPAPPTGKGCTMRISPDDVHCYHLPAIRWLNRSDLLEKPAINCGVVYLSGSVYDNYPGFEELMQFMRIFNEPFAEQTTFALLADRLGDTWTPEEIMINTADIHWPWVPRYLFSGSQIARHHVATKHSWFWRDALFILFSKHKPHRRAAAV
jgi:hypothetical protein